MEKQRALINKINSGEALVGILGLGYVGLPLAVTFARHDITVLGFEKDQRRVEKVNNADNYISDVDSAELRALVEMGTFSATHDFSQLSRCDAIVICVPTPLDKFKKPNMSFIESACISIGQFMKPGAFISLESTTYPTTTENFMKPILERESGLTAEEDFWLCFSPERVDPGNKDFTTENTPKIIGCTSSSGLEIAMTLYGKAINKLHPVSSPRVAEMVKILENTYRLINISLINEMALLAGKMKIDIWEVIEAAKTKPYGFQAFYPGPGIGGHCIPLDPFYLEYVAKQYGFDLTMIETAGHIDNLMPHRMTIKISSALNHQRKSISGSQIVVLGLAYKKDIADERESPALHIIEELLRKGANVTVHDPFISECRTESGYNITSVPLTNELLQNADCVVITTDHSLFSAQQIVDNSQLVVDLRNLIKFKSPKVYKL